MPAAEYDQQLEKLLTELALKTTRHSRLEAREQEAMTDAGVSCLAAAALAGRRGGGVRAAAVCSATSPARSRRCTNIPLRRPVHVRADSLYRHRPGELLLPRAFPRGRTATSRRAAATRAEDNLMKIMNEVTLPQRRTSTDSIVVALDDPELFKYPVAYMTEPGFWTMNDKEAAGLRAYLQKGGFVIFDDFRTTATSGAAAAGRTSKATCARVIPGARSSSDWIRRCRSSTRSSRSTSFDIIPQAYDRGQPEFFGLFEDNDPKKRLMVDRELQHRHLGLLGVLGHRLPADRRIERGIQARRELHHLRHDALNSGRSCGPSGPHAALPDMACTTEDLWT